MAEFGDELTMRLVKTLRAVREHLWSWRWLGGAVGGAVLVAVAVFVLVSPGLNPQLAFDNVARFWAGALGVFGICGVVWAAMAAPRERGTHESGKSAGQSSGSSSGDAPARTRSASASETPEATGTVVGGAGQQRPTGENYADLGARVDTLKARVNVVLAEADKRHQTLSERENRVLREAADFTAGPGKRGVGAAEDIELRSRMYRLDEQLVFIEARPLVIEQAEQDQLRLQGSNIRDSRYLMNRLEVAANFLRELEGASPSRSVHNSPAAVAAQPVRAESPPAAVAAATAAEATSTDGEAPSGPGMGATPPEVVASESRTIETVEVEMKRAIYDYLERGNLDFSELGELMSWLLDQRRPRGGSQSEQPSQMPDPAPPTEQSQSSGAEA